MSKSTKQTLLIDLCDSSETEEFKVEVRMNKSNDKKKNKKEEQKKNEDDVILEVDEDNTKMTESTTEKEDDTEALDGRKRKANEVTTNETTNETRQTFQGMQDGSYYRDTKKPPHFRVTKKNKQPPHPTDDDDDEDKPDPWAQATKVTYPVPLGNKVYYRQKATDRNPLILIFRFHMERHPPLQEHLEDIVKSFVKNKFPLLQTDPDSMQANGPHELRETMTIDGNIKDGSVLARVDFYCTTHKDYDETNYTQLCLQTVESHVIYTMGKGSLRLIVASNCLHVFKYEDNAWHFSTTKTLQPGNKDDLVCVRPCMITQYLDEPNFVSSYPVC